MLNQIVSAAREAGRMMLKYRDAAIHQKEGHFNYVTDTDVKVQQFLQKELLSLLPGSRFFAEEQENDPLTDAPTRFWSSHENSGQCGRFEVFRRMSGGAVVPA